MDTAILSIILSVVIITLTALGFVRDLIQNERLSEFDKMLAENSALKDRIAVMQVTIDTLRELLTQRTGRGDVSVINQGSGAQSGQSAAGKGLEQNQ